MKYQCNVLKRVRQIEEKNGIKYAKTDGKLYGGVKAFYLVASIWTLAMNLLFIISNLLVNSLNENFKLQTAPLATVAVLTLALVAGFVVMRFKNYIWANFTFGILNLLMPSILCFTFANLMTNINGLWGYSYSFYWRHAMPLLLVAVCGIWLAIIAFRANIKTQKQYKKTLENIYEQYNLSLENENFSEEQWKEYLKNYEC